MATNLLLGALRASPPCGTCPPSDATDVTDATDATSSITPDETAVPAICRCRFFGENNKGMTVDLPYTMQILGFMRAII